MPLLTLLTLGPQGKGWDAVLRKGGKTDTPSWYHLEVKVSMTVAFGS